MSRKALGRGLGDLLHHARPARAVNRAAAAEPIEGTPTESGPPIDSHRQECAPDPEPQAAPMPAAVTLPPTTIVPPTPTLPQASSQPSPLSAPDRPVPGSRLPRFGPSYTPPPPPEPPGPPGRGGLYLVLVVDLLLMVFAAAMAFGPWVQRPLAFYLAAAAVLVGGTLACGAIAYQAKPHRPASGSPKPSRVRVRLTRL